MFEAILIGGGICGTVAGVGYGCAAIIREYYKGRATLVRAERGDPEHRDEGTAAPVILLQAPREG